MSRAGTDRRSIGHVFYETRVLLGREFTLRRFASEILAKSVDPVMLGYIEKGQRFPSEALVRRLAAVRKEDPLTLLALLWRDRILRAFGKELKKVLRAGEVATGIADADLAVLVSQAIAALPDDGSALSLSRWRNQYRRGSDRRARGTEVTDALVEKVESVLVERNLVEIDGRSVRRQGRHFVAREGSEKQSLALEFCALFAKSLIAKLSLPGAGRDTYLRNHFLHIAPDRLPDFQRRLDEVLRGLAEEFADDPTAQSHFLNVLVAATPL